MYTMWAKNLVEIALSCTVSEINAFLLLTLKFMTVTKSGGKMILGKKMPDYSVCTLRAKNFIQIALSYTVFKINFYKINNK